MKKRKVKKSVVRLVLRIVSIFIICYFFITVISYGIKIKTLSNLEKKYSSELVNLKEDEEKLKSNIVKLNDKEYIARYAREHYLYTKDGEIALKIDNTEKIDESFQSEPDYSIIYICFAGTICFLILIILNHKRKKIVKKIKKSRK